MTITIPFWIIPVAGFICGAIGAMTFDLLNRKKKCNHTALIDKETISNEIERRKNTAETIREREAYLDLLSFIDTHEAEEKDAFCKENCKGYQDTGRCFCDGDCEAKKKSKEKEVDLEEHYKQWLDEYMEQSEGYYPTAQAIARHFYELGCRHTAVMYDDIEHERQRAEEAEEAEITNNLEEAAMSYYLSDFTNPQHYGEDGKPYPIAINDAFIAGAEWGAEHAKK